MSFKMSVCGPKQSTLIGLNSLIPWRCTQSGHRILSVNSSPPSAAYMRQWIGSVLVEVMSCRLLGGQAITSTNATLLSIGLFGNKFQWNMNQNSLFFIHENSFENVICDMAAILYRGRWVILTSPISPRSEKSAKRFENWQTLNQWF